jgi:predicted Zn-dependent protease with MMP-like domain
LAAEGIAKTTGTGDVLTAAELTPIVDYAVAAWKATDLDATQAQRLDEVHVQIADLPDDMLGQTIGNSIVLDYNAAGFGWYVDATPWDDGEFAESQVEARVGDSMDVLTTVMHELGHIVGLSDLYDPGADNDLMFAWLDLGVRKASLEASLADAAFADF